MSLVYPSLTQGIVAGGAAAYLYGHTKEQAHQNTSRTWMSMALQVNHLLLLAAENLSLAGSPLGMFGSLVRSAPVLAPLAAVVTIYNKDKGMPFKAERIDQFNALYRAGVIAGSCASFALGSPVFAAASLTMLAIDVVAEGKAKEVFDVAKKVTAAAAFIGYGSQIFASEKVSALIAKVSTFLTGSKLLFDALPEEKGEENAIESSDEDSSEECTSCCHSTRKDNTSDDTSSIGDLDTREPAGQQQKSENVFCRESVW